jgi:molecular chaperone DnaK
MYADQDAAAAAHESAGAAGAAGAAEAKPDDGNVVDAEFEEVKNKK